MIKATKIFEISYSHFLPGHEGECGGVHGHNATIEIEVTRLQDPDGSSLESSMVMDFGDLKARAKPVIDKLDHKHLNDLTFFQDYPPTAEMIVQWIAANLEAKDRLGSLLNRIRFYETSTNFVEWERDDQWNMKDFICGI